MAERLYTDISSPTKIQQKLHFQRINFSLNGHILLRKQQ